MNKFFWKFQVIYIKIYFYFKFLNNLNSLFEYFFKNYKFIF